MWWKVNKRIRVLEDAVNGILKRQIAGDGKNNCNCSQGCDNTEQDVTDKISEDIKKYITYRLIEFEFDIKEFVIAQIEKHKAE